MTSNYKRRALNIVNRWLGRLGLHISHTSELTLEAALRRVAWKSVPVNTVIDIGASDGCWTARVLPFIHRRITGCWMLIPYMKLP